MTIALASLPKRRVCTEALAIGPTLPLNAPVAAGPYRSGTSLRRYISPTHGRGYEDIVRIGDGLFMITCQRVLSTDEPTNFVGEDVLKMHFRLAGDSLIVLPTGQSQELRGPLCGVMLHPRGLDKGELNSVGVEQRWATILCSQRLLTDSLGVEPDGMPGALRRFLKREPVDLFSAALPLTPGMARAVTDLLDEGMSGSLRSVYAEGKCLELVASVLALLRDSRGDDPVGPRLSSRDLECVRYAREIIEKEFASPPSLDALARRIGINQNKLNHGFRQLFSRTVGDYANECRMRRAEELLRLGELSIAQVAYQVGYDFPGNFTTAFKRFYGVLPRSARKAGR